jgi:hypothetical protein
VHGIVAHPLRDRDQLDAVFRGPGDVKFKLEGVTEEAAERMDDDDIERRRLAGARFDHALEFGPAIIGGGSAWLDIGLGELITACGTVRFALPLLIRDRDIVLGLPRRGDALLQGGAQRHGHRDCPLRSSVQPEQFIEEIAEPCLEHVELGVCDRHGVRPIVRDRPRPNIVLERAPDARPGLRLDVRIVGRNAQAGA